MPCDNIIIAFPSCPYSGNSGGNHYTVNLVLFAELDEEGNEWKVNPQSVAMKV